MFYKHILFFFVELSKFYCKVHHHFNVYMYKTQIYYQKHKEKA